MSLRDIALKHGAVKVGEREMRYLDVYERMVPRDKRINLLELGTYEGGGAAMWREWLHKDSGVWTVDKVVPSKFFEGITYLTHDLSEGAPKAIQGQKFDVIIDDASHIVTLTMSTFGELYPYVKPGGYYIIEDTHVAFAGLPWSTGSGAADFMPLLMDLFDEIGCTIEDVYMREGLIVVRKLGW